MNTLPPLPRLQTPGLRDPLLCIFSFLGKCRNLAFKRGDHGTVLELNVMEKFAVREKELRDAGATSVRIIAEKIAAIQEYQRQAMADGRLSPAEDRYIRDQLAALYAQLIALQSELAVPVTG